MCVTAVVSPHKLSTAMVCVSGLISPHGSGVAVVFVTERVSPHRTAVPQRVCFRPGVPSQSSRPWCVTAPESPPEPDFDKVQVPSDPRQGLRFGLSVSPQMGAG